MRIANIELKGPAKYLAISLAGLITYTTVTAFNSKDIEKIVSIDQKVQLSQAAEEKWGEIPVDEKVYRLKTGYRDLPERERKEVADYLFKDIFETKTEDIANKIRSVLSYALLRFRDDGGIDNPEGQLENIYYLNKHLGGQK